jgi:putative ABC transport system permease protein
MIRNYLKIAWRNLWKGRVFNLLNIIGLSVAVACCTLLFLTVYYEYSYDNFHEKRNEIYQVYNVTNRSQGVEKSSSMAIPFAPSIKAEYPAVKHATRSAGSGAIVRYGNKQLEQNIHFADPDFLQMFTFPLAEGNSATAMSQLNNVLLTESAAKALFGDEPALNKSITLNIANVEKPFIVSGIIKDYPENSSFDFDMLLRFEHIPYYQENISTWDNRTHLVFIELPESYNAADFTGQMKPFVKKHYASDIDNLKRDGAKPDQNGNLVSLAILPFASNHFNTGIGGVEGNAVSRIYPISLMIIGCFILVIACINFINLSVARGFTRAREVGVRKTLGAGIAQLLTQFWTETMLVCFIATVIGLVWSILIINPFKAIFKSRITLAMLLEPMHLAGIIILFLLITALAGFYPALMMARYKTVAVLKGNSGSGKPGSLRNTLLVVQFTLSTLLIICTIITWQQISYLNNKPLGYNKTEVLSIPINRGIEGSKALQLMRNELQSNPNVVAVSGSYMNIGRGNDGSSRTSVLGFDLEGREVRTSIYRVDYDYVKTLDIKLLEGREFSQQFPADSSSVIINEAMARQLGFKNPVGKFLNMFANQPRAQVIGVIKDYNFRSLHEDIGPLTLTMGSDYAINYIFVKVKPGSLLRGYDEIKNAWHRQFANAEFNASWLNENTERQYLNERRLSGIFVSGAVLAILISCIGLLAISIMMVLQRTKEIGIRKVLGANVAGIVLLLSRDFVKLVLLAAIISFPAAWWLMSQWLQGFAYRVQIQWWVFAVSTVLAIVLAFITISFQSIKAALANPVKSLRSE